MRIKMALMGMMVTVAMCGTAAAFGLPKLPGVAAGGGNPDEFLRKVQASEALVNKSASLLFKMVASKEAQAKVEAIQKKLAATSDPEEKKAIVKEKTDSEIAEINIAAKDKSLSATAKRWDAAKKRQGTDALFNLALGGKIAAELVPEGQNLAKSMQSNPMMLTKAGSILSAVKSLGGIATGTGKVMMAIPPVFTAANIEAKLPTSSKEKPKPMDDITD
jgi:hypothetical protein